jgi:hypothetical protein
MNMTTAMWHRRMPTPRISDNEKKIRAVIRSNSPVRIAYENDLQRFAGLRMSGVEGPELPKLSEMQGWPGLEMAGFIAARVAHIEKNAE